MVEILRYSIKIKSPGLSGTLILAFKELSYFFEPLEDDPPLEAAPLEDPPLEEAPLEDEPLEDDPPEEDPPFEEAPLEDEPLDAAFFAVAIF